jgi:serine/threonine-protein kinase
MHREAVPVSPLILQGADSMGECLIGDYSTIDGRYDLRRPLGRGGMATVYLSRDLRHDRDVAIKVLRPDLARSIAATRFLREIRVTARLQHPHILTLIDSGEYSGVLYYVMPYVDGVNLSEQIDVVGRFDLSDAVHIVDQVASALEHAHRLGVVHRDVKPANILLTGRHALLADFGVALAFRDSATDRVTESGHSPGTPVYMSSEQARGVRKIDGRADQYSLACVLFEMLTGEPLFTGSPQAVIARHARERPPSLRVLRPDVSEALESAMNWALAKEPRDRFKTVTDFAEAVRGAAGLGLGRESEDSVWRPSARRKPPGGGWAPHWVRRLLCPTSV